jgi:hypothetical protein
MAPGTVASLDCKVSYQLTFEPGYAKITCQEDGKWDKPLFTCTQGQLGSKWLLIYQKIKIIVQILNNITIFYHTSSNLAL